MKQHCILTTWLNHSWKTTFSYQLRELLPTLVVYENDQIRNFFRDVMPNLYRMGYDEVDAIKNENIKHRMLTTILQYTYELWWSICLANVFAYSQYRAKILSLAESIWYECSIIYFNIPYEILQQRLHVVAKEKDSRNYQWKFAQMWKDPVHVPDNMTPYELMEWNLRKLKDWIYQPPSSSECKNFYEITNDSDWEQVQNNIVNIFEKK